MRAPRSHGLLARAWLWLRLAWAGWRYRRREGEEGARARDALLALFRDGRGLALKVGQLLADSPSAAAVQAEPLPLDVLLPGLERALGRRWEQVFRRLDPGATAASLGQVHRGELLDGTPVAVKVRYPHIDRAVAAELRLLGLAPGVGPLERFGFRLDGYRRVLRENMDRELDYQSEAARQGRFAARTAVPGVVVPRVFPELCRQNLLVQSWEEGVDLATAAGWPRRDRAGLARALVTLLLASLFRGGEVHADPNPGNYLYRRPDGKPQVVLLDYGCTLELARERRLGLLKLIVATREASAVDPLSCLAALGFEAAKLEAIAGQLPGLCQVLFEPFLLDRPFDPASWHLGDRMDALLGELRWWFRAAGPPDLLLLVRSFQGLVEQLGTLAVPLPWWPLLQQAVGNDELAAARAWEPPPLAATTTAGSLASLARLLKVSIHEGDAEVLTLAMPAAEVAHLDTLVPAEIQGKIAALGVDLAARTAGILARGIEPQEVVRVEDSGRTYRVWLE